VSAFLALIQLVAASGCHSSVNTAEDGQGEIETCDDGVRNDEWDIDCSAACNHVMTCKATDGDSDLESLSCNDCLGSCLAGVELGGDDIAESTEEARRGWECAELVEGCSSLDHNCDLY
jgi:hypothetical protein